MDKNMFCVKIENGGDQQNNLVAENINKIKQILGAKFSLVKHVTLNEQNYLVLETHDLNIDEPNIKNMFVCEPLRNISFNEITQISNKQQHSTDIKCFFDITDQHEINVLFEKDMEIIEKLLGELSIGGYSMDNITDFPTYKKIYFNREEDSQHIEAFLDKIMGIKVFRNNDFKKLKNKTKEEKYFKIVIGNIPPNISDSYMLNNVIKKTCPNIQPISFILEKAKNEYSQRAHIVVEEESNVINLKDGINGVTIRDDSKGDDFCLNATIEGEVYYKDCLTISGIHIFFFVVEEKYKFLTLIDVLEEIPDRNVLVYSNTIDSADALQQQMTIQGLKSSSYHEGIEISQRETILHQFRTGEKKIISTTDSINNFINKNSSPNVQISFELPLSFKQFLHRFGRWGCYGRKGFAILLCDICEIEQLGKFEKYFNIKIEELPNNFADYC